MTFGRSPCGTLWVADPGCVDRHCQVWHSAQIRAASENEGEMERRRQSGGRPEAERGRKRMRGKNDGGRERRRRGEERRRGERELEDLL